MFISDTVRHREYVNHKNDNYTIILSDYYSCSSVYCRTVSNFSISNEQESKPLELTDVAREDGESIEEITVDEQ